MIQERIQKVEELLQRVKEHCMCFDFEENNEYYFVIYPEGYYPNGIRIDKTMGKAKSLEILLEKMEEHWQDSLFWKK